MPRHGKPKGDWRKYDDYAREESAREAAARIRAKGWRARVSIKGGRWYVWEGGKRVRRPRNRDVQELDLPEVYGVGVVKSSVRLTKRVALISVEVELMGELPQSGTEVAVCPKMHRSRI